MTLPDVLGCEGEMSGDLELVTVIPSDVFGCEGIKSGDFVTVILFDVLALKE